MRSFGWLGLCAALLGCGNRAGPLILAFAGAGGSQPSAAGESAAGSQAQAAGAAAAGSGGVVGSSDTLKLAIVARGVPPDGQEHVCVVVELPNTLPVWVDRIDAVLSGGSHHLIVDRKPAGTPLNSEPAVCSPTMASDASRLMIAQQPKTEVRLPAGVAFKLEAHQRVFMQLHYFNFTGTTHDIRGDVELSVLNTSAAPPIEAKTLFTGATTIDIPPHADSETSAFFKPVAPNGARRLFALTSHTHHLGVHNTIERVSSASAPDTTPLHESRDWSEPPLTFFDPPLRFDGGDGLRLICRYHNDGEQAVHFGVEAQDEMCFMWLYYYDTP
jgi:hypothetical protein